MTKTLLKAIVCVFFLFGAHAEVKGAQDALKRILFIDSYASMDNWTLDLAIGFRGYLNDNGIAASYEVIELGVRYLPGLEPLQQDIAAIQAKIDSTPYDLIVTSNNAATDLFLNGTITVPANLPIVCTSYSGDLTQAGAAQVNMTGIETPLNLFDNIIYAMTLQPEARQIVLIADASADGEVQRRLHNQLNVSNKGMDVRVFRGADYTTPELLEALKTIDKNAIIFFHSWGSAKERVPETSYTVLPKIKRLHPSNLIMGKYDSYLRIGSEGGIMPKAQEQGQLAADFAFRIFGGESAAEIPVRQSILYQILDYNAIAAHGIKKADIPSETRIINCPPSFWVRNQSLIIVALLALAAFAGCIFLYLLRNRHAHRLIHSMFANMPVRIIVVNRAMKVLYSHIPDDPALKAEVEKNTRDISETFNRLLGSPKASVMRVFETGHPVSIDYEMNKKWRHVEFHRLPSETFREPTVMWFSTDVSEIHSLHESSIELAERFRLTLESIGDGVIATDTEERITLLNPVAAELLGWEKEKLIGQKLDNVFNIISYQDGKPVGSPLKTALQENRVVELSNHTDLISKDGKRYHISDSASPIHDENGAVTGGVLIFRDVSEEYSQRDRMRMTNSMLESATAIANVSYFTVNQAGEVVFKSDNLPDWSDRNGELAPPASIICDEELPAGLEAWKSVVEGRAPEFHIFCTGIDGSKKRYYQIRMVRSQEDPDSEALFVGMVQDITELRESEIRAQQASERFALTLESIGDGVIATDKDQTITLLNPVAARLLGWEKEELVGKKLDDVFNIVSYLDGKPVESPLPRALTEGRVIELANHTDLISKDGKRYHIADSAAPIRDKDGVITGGVLVFRDVTAEYEQRDHLRMSNTILSSATAIANVSYFTANQAGEITSRSDNLPEWKLRHGEMAPPEEFANEAELPRFMTAWKKLVAGETDMINLISTGEKRGTQTYYQVRVVRALNEYNGEYTLFGMAQDITELKETEARSLQLAERFRLTLASIGDGVIATDKDERITLVNPVAARLLGYSEQEVIGLPLGDVFKTVNYIDKQDATTPLRKALETNSVVEMSNHIDLIARDGTRYHISDSAAPIHDESGQITGGVLIFRDVTEEYEKRDQMRATNLILGSATEIASVFYFTASGDGKILTKSDNLPDWEPRGGMIAPPDSFLCEDDLPAFMDAWQKVVAGEADSMQFYFSGNEAVGERHYQIKMVRTFNEDSAQYIIIGMVQDVTELRESETRAQQAAERFRLTLESIGDGVIATDADERITMLNPVAARLMGYASCEELVGQLLDDVFHIVSYLDDQPVPSPLRKALSENRIVELANHTDLIAKDGKRYHISDSAAPIHNDEGEITGGVLVFRDVTEEYRKRDHMRMTNAVLGSATDVAGLSYFKCDDTGKITFRSPNLPYWETEGGIPIEPEEWINPGNLDEFNQAWISLIAGKTEDFSIIYSTHYRQTEERYYQMRVVRSDDEYTGERAFFGIVQDITELKKTELKSLDNLVLLKAVMNSLPCYIFAKRVEDDFRYVLCNKGFEEVVGRDESEIIGQTDYEIFKESGDADKFLADDRALFESGKPLDEKETFVNGEGGKTIVRIMKDVITQSDGTHLLLGMGVDITQQEEYENQLRMFLKQEQLVKSCLEVVVRRSSGDPMTTLLELIGKYAHATGSYIMKFDDPGKKPDCNYFWSPEDNDILSFLNNIPADHPWLTELLKGNMIAVGDIPKATTPDVLLSQAEFARHNIHSTIIAPIWVDNTIYGCLGLSYDATRDFTDHDKQFMQAVTHIAEMALSSLHAQEELERNEYENQLILDTVNTPILLFDGAMNLIRINKAAAELAGLDEKIILKRPCYESYCHGQVGEGQCPVQNTRKDLQTHSAECVINGKELYIESHPIVIEGKLTYIVENCFDMTEFNRNKKELLKAIEAAQSADRAKSYFLATMSHELRTPLNAVIGFSEILQHETLSSEQQTDYLKSINISGNALLALINDVLDLSKIEADQLVITPVRTDIASMISDIAAIFKLKASEKHLTLRTEGSEGIPALYLDSARIRQILLNLMGNAIKFTHKGSITLKTDFSVDEATREKGILSISVVDTGIGISAENQARIFDPFVQADQVRGGRAYEGSGLGLAISRRLIERMGGTLTLESEIDKGSSFTITVEAKICPEKMHDFPAEAKLPKVPEKEPELPVLLVDDVKMNLKVLEAMLKRLKVKSLAASSADEALQILHQNSVGLVLTDLWMPNVTGQELAEAIRSIPTLRNVHIYAVTADTEADNSFNMQAFDGILQKPISLNSLASILGKLTGNA